jgi:hypothetical protein
LSNGKAYQRKTDIDHINQSDIMRRELYGITRRKSSGINPGAVLSGGSAGIGGGLGGGSSTPGVGDNLGNHIATMQLNMAQWLQTNYVGWTGVTLGQRDYVDVTGVSHFLPNAESYKWFIDNELIPLYELTEFGAVYGTMYYGVDFSDNYASFHARHKPGNPSSTERHVYMDEVTHQLSVVRDNGDIVPLEKDYVTIGVIIDGGIVSPLVGYHGNIFVDFNAVLESYKMTVDGTGSASIAVYRATQSEYPNAVHLLGTLTITNGWKTSGSISGSILNGDLIFFRVLSVTTSTRISVGLKCRRVT